MQRERLDDGQEVEPGHHWLHPRHPARVGNLSRESCSLYIGTGSKPLVHRIQNRFFRKTESRYGSKGQGEEKTDPLNCAPLNQIIDREIKSKKLYHWETFELTSPRHLFTSIATLKLNVKIDKGINKDNLVLVLIYLWHLRHVQCSWYSTLILPLVMTHT